MRASRMCQKVDRALRALQAAGYWPVNMYPTSEGAVGVLIPDGRRVEICLGDGFVVLTGPAKSPLMEHIYTVPLMIKTLRGVNTTHKRHYPGVSDSPLCGNLPGHYATKPILTEVWDDVTCQKCLRRRESVDVPKTDPSRKQGPDEVVPRPSVPGLLSHTE